MGKRSIVRKPVINYGHRTGTKKSDRHWTDPEGNIWDSRYEYLVFRAYAEAGHRVRRTTKGDSFSFVLSIKRGQCGACGSTEVGQLRTYTADLHVTADHTKHEALDYYVEAKGYLRPKERALLRAFYKANPNAPVRYLLQRDFPASKRSKVTGKQGSIVDWFHKFLPNAKLAIWSGNVPLESDWKAALSVEQPKKTIQRRRSKHYTRRVSAQT